MKHLKILSILAGLCFASAALATDYYVNPTGNDAWTGTLKTPTAKLTDGPFKTLERAKAAIRTLKKTNTFTSKVTVNIASGIYYLNAPLNFNLTDSGLLGREILWQGEPGAKVTISAGLPITCKKRNATFWDCPLTKLPVNRSYFDTNRIKGNAPKFELYVNEQKMELARWPDQGWAHISMPLNKSTQFSVMEKLPAFIGNIKNAQVHIFPGNDYYDEYLGISSITSSSNSIQLTSTSKFPLASGRQFYVQNILSELNAPGEWLYDSTTKKIRFIPPIGSTPQQIIISSLPNILVLQGVSYLGFKNLILQHSTATTISSNNSSNIILDNLNINKIGGKAIDITDGNNILISNNEIHHIGGGAIYISGGNKATLTGANQKIYNNHIHHIGTTLMTVCPAIAIGGVGVQVTHNLLEQGPNAGILINGNEHLIEKNELHHFCLQSSDCGAIYTSADWTMRGNIIRNNFIHDIIGYGLESVDLPHNKVKFSSPFDARGVYIDDGTSGFEIAGNIIKNVSYISIVINGGRDNNIHDNYISTSGYALGVKNREKYLDWTILLNRLSASPYKTAPWVKKYPALAAPMHNYKWPEGNRIERNVFVSTNKLAGSPFFDYSIPAESTTISDNIYWHDTVSFIVYNELLGVQPFKVSKWGDWAKSGVEQASLYLDPCVTINNNQITTCPTTPLKNINFAPIPQDIGLIK